ncbi:MAG TPA: GyrI-like domain-containing protein [Thermoplasmata archaeon]|nr:GyrI-like domain-containing protein [Thermoplasmata archaeon]
MPASSRTPKVDLHREFADEYSTPSTPQLIRVKPARYLAARGAGVPGGPEFGTQLIALFSVAYTLKFDLRRKGHDFRVMMLEGLYDLPAHDPVPPAAGATRWTLLIRVPSFVRKSDVTAAVRALQARGKRVSAGQVELLRVAEGRTVQLLHVGSYASETSSVESMLGFARRHHLALKGPHHEIYLSDPRRVPASRLRTILRYPTVAAAAT